MARNTKNVNFSDILQIHLKCVNPWPRIPKKVDFSKKVNISEILQNHLKISQGAGGAGEGSVSPEKVVDLGCPLHDAVHGKEKVVSSLEVDHDLTLGRTQETQNSQFWGGRYISYDLTLSN